MFRMVDWAQFIYNVQKHVLEAIVISQIFGDEAEGFGPTVIIQGLFSSHSINSLKKVI